MLKIYSCGKLFMLAKSFEDALRIKQHGQLMMSFIFTSDLNVLASI